MALKLASIERIKLAASLLNSTAVAVASLGVFAPIIYPLTVPQSASATSNTAPYAVIWLCAIGALALHLLGQATLGFLEAHELPEADNDRQ
jgi:hypothetical protein